MKSLVSLALAAGALLCSGQALATRYPVDVTDMAGQTWHLDHEPKRVVVQDGRDIMTLALLDRDDPFQRLVAWNNLLKKGDARTWQLLEKKWPQADNIIDMGFGDKGDVNLESVIAEKPDLMIAQLRAKSALAQSGVLDKLKALHVPVLFIDTMLKPVENTPRSVTLLGSVLNRESQAKAYVDFYHQHYQHILEQTARVEPKPLVFIEAKAGLGGLDNCCYTHSHVGWGALVEAVGGRNVGSLLLPGPTGDIAMEKVIALQPDVYIISGASWDKNSNAAVPFGTGVTQPQIDAAFRRLETRTGFSELNAVKNHRLYGVYHSFYNHPYNIVGMEYLAKFIFPQQFASLDPAQTYSEILTRFTQLPQAEGILGAQAPAN